MTTTNPPDIAEVGPSAHRASAELTKLVAVKRGFHALRVPDHFR